MAARTATNPDTGEQVVLVGDQWFPVERTATNPDTGAKAYLAANQWIVGDPPAQEETSLLGYVPETLKAIGAGGAGMVESALTGAAFLLPEEAEQAARRKIAEIGGGVQEFLAPDEAYEGTYLDLMRGIGSTLPFLAAAPFGVAGVAAGTALGVGAGAGEAAQRAEAAGATEEDISTAAMYGTIPGALEMVGPTRIVRRVLGRNTDEIADQLSNKFSARLERVLQGRAGRVGKAALEEAAQEASSEVLQNLIAQGVYDPDTGTFEGVGESAKIGGGVGGVLQFFADIIIPRDRGKIGDFDTSVFEEGAEGVAPEPEVGATADMFAEPDRLLDVEELAGTTEEEPIAVGEPEVIDTKELGISPNSNAAKAVRGKDITDPVQKQEVFDTLSKYAANPKTKDAARRKTLELLASPTFQDIEVSAAQQAAIEEQGRREEDLESQVDIEEVIAQDVREEQQDLAYAQRAEQVAEEEARAAEERQQAFELAEQEREEQKTQEEARARAAQRPDVPTAMEAALQTAERTGRPVAGQRQLEIPAIEAADPVDQEIADIQRRIERQEAQEAEAAADAAAGPAPEQGALLGPRGGPRITMAQPESRLKEAASGADTGVDILTERVLDRSPDPVALSQDQTYTPKPTSELDVPLGMHFDSEPSRYDDTRRIFLRSASRDYKGPKGRESEGARDYIGYILHSPNTHVVHDADNRVIGTFTTEQEAVDALAAKGRVRDMVANQVGEPLYPFFKSDAEVTTTVAEGGREAANEPIVEPDAAPEVVEQAKPNKRSKTRKKAKKQAKQSNQPLLALNATPVNNRKQYQPEQAAKFYLDSSTDFDQMLRNIAFDINKPVESTIKNKFTIRKAEAAKSWVDANMPAETVTKLDSYVKEAATVERQRVIGDLGRSPKGRQKEIKQKRREIQQNETKVVENYADMEALDGLKMEVLDGIISEMETTSADPDPDAVTFDQLLNRGQDALRADAVAATMALADTQVTEQVNRGSALGALKAIFDTNPNVRVRSATVTLAKAIRGVNLTTVAELNDSKGNPLAGVYDRATNTILINTSVPLSTHTILHEATHAGVANVLSQKSASTTKALNSIYEAIKDTMPDAYGSQSLEDFVAEAFTNPEFQARLAAYRPNGEPKTLWQRFREAIQRFIGISTSSADTEVQNYINEILATEANTRRVTDVPSQLAVGENAEAATTLTSGGKGFIRDTPRTDLDDNIGIIARSSDKVRANFLNGVGLEAISDVLKLKIPEAKQFEQILYKINGSRTEGMKTYVNLRNDIVRAFKNDRIAKEIYDQLIIFTTTNQVDPTGDPDRYKKFWLVYGERDKSGNLQRKESSYATKAQAEVARRKVQDRLDKEKAANPNAEPTELSIAEISIVEPNRERVANFDKAVREFNKLNKRQKAAYTGLRDFYSDINDRIIAAEESNIESLGLNKKTRVTIRDAMFLKRLKSGFIEPYFPLTRSGDKWVEFTYRDDNGQTQYGTMAFEKEGDRDRAIRRLKEMEGVDTSSVRRRPLSEIQQQTYDNTIPLSFLSDLRKQVGEIEAANPEAQKRIDEFLAELTLRALPDQSLIQSRMVRQGIAGMEGDAVVSLEQRAPQLVDSLANLENVIALEDTARTIREKRDALPEEEVFIKEAATIVAGTKDETSRQFMGKVPSYLQFAKNPYLPSWARHIRAGTFIATLGANISSVAVNMSILPLQLQSRLAAKYGPARATMSTSLALALNVQTFGKTSREDIEGKEVRELGGFSITNDFSRRPELAKKIEPYAPLSAVFKDRGVDTRGSAEEITELDNPVTPLMQKATYASGFLFNHSERMIKQASAMSVYRLELENLVAKARGVKEGSVPFRNITKEEVAKFGEAAAETAMDETLFVNTSSLLTTAPRIAQTGAGSLLWQFKRVPGQFLYTHLSMIKTLFEDMTGKARTEAEREEARVMRNMFFYLTASGGALVGVKGLPFYGVVIALMNQFLEDDEDDANTLVAKMLGEDMYYGLIANMLGVDVTDRIALTNLMIRDRGNYRSDSFVESVVDQWGGPAVGIGLRSKRGLENLFSDNPYDKQRAWEDILPTSVSNLFKAYRLETEGYETRRGDAILAGDIPFGDVLKQAMGFSPISTRAARDKTALNTRKEIGRKQRKKDILDKIAYGREFEIPSMVEEGFQEMSDYNEDHPGTAIDLKTIERSQTSRTIRGAMAAASESGNPAERGVISEIQRSNAEFNSQR